MFILSCICQHQCWLSSVEFVHNSASYLLDPDLRQRCPLDYVLQSTQNNELKAVAAVAEMAARVAMMSREQGQCSICYTGIYISLCYGSCYLRWLREVMAELRIYPTRHLVPARYRADACQHRPDITPALNAWWDI